MSFTDLTITFSLFHSFIVLFRNVIVTSEIFARNLINGGKKQNELFFFTPYLFKPLSQGKNALFTSKQDHISILGWHNSFTCNKPLPMVLIILIHLTVCLQKLKVSKCYPFFTPSTNNWDTANKLHLKEPDN